MAVADSNRRPTSGDTMRAVDLGIAGKVALVTGASKGLGLAAAAALSNEGVTVLVNARDAERLEAAAAALPGPSLAIAGDVTDPSMSARLVATARERLGGLDILVANAGGPPAARALEIDDDALRRAVEANLLTSVRLVREAVPLMRAAGWGRIALITSSAVKQPIPTLTASNTARAGLWGWAKTAAQDLIDDGITLNLVCPGLHATDRVRELGMSGRMGDPQDFGRVVAFLCSAPAGFVSGSAVSVDGAGTLGLL
jgi:3-oxoacyl-[acyl-carrier protein] reductase